MSLTVEKIIAQIDALSTDVRGLVALKMAWYSTACSLTWNKLATKSSRFTFQLAASAPRTNARGSGLLPTPRQWDGMKGASPVVIMWPRDRELPPSCTDEELVYVTDIAGEKPDIDTLTELPPSLASR